MKKLIALIIIMITFTLAACSADNVQQGQEKTITETIKIGAIPDQNAADSNRSMKDF
ncbi:MAG TPA: putative selenate ABC transporter substrate-binding protein, partial [Bacillus bacterium]|nr:putative selenate ABC transporter substrate-binding protein [Bacillus sp. (in: firmicutes)]